MSCGVQIRECYICGNGAYVWCANIVVRNQLQLFILHIEIHPTVNAIAQCAILRVPMSVCICNGWKSERHTTQFSLVLHIVHPRWRYHYKLHHINIHLPIYSMSCGNSTIHVLFLLHLCISLYTYTEREWKRDEFATKMSKIEKLSLFADAILYRYAYKLVRISFIHFRCTTTIDHLQIHRVVGPGEWGRKRVREEKICAHTYVTVNKGPFISVAG